MSLVNSYVSFVRSYVSFVRSYVSFACLWCVHISQASHITYECVMCFEWMRNTGSYGRVISYESYEWIISHMNESYHVWMRHVFRMNVQHWVIWMSHITRVIWMSYITYEWVISRMHASCVWNERATLGHMNESYHTSHMNESYHTWMSHITYEYVMCLEWMCNTGSYERVISHESYEWVTSHMNESYHVWMRHVFQGEQYGVATNSRLLKITSLFHKRALWKRRYSAKETYTFKEPTNHSHPISSHVGKAT